MILSTIMAALMSPARALSQYTVWSSSGATELEVAHSSMLSTHGKKECLLHDAVHGTATGVPHLLGDGLVGGAAEGESRPGCASQLRAPGYERRPVTLGA